MPQPPAVAQGRVARSPQRRLRSPLVAGLAVVVLLESLAIGILVGHISAGGPRRAAAAAAGHIASRHPRAAGPAASELLPSSGHVVFSSDFGENDGWPLGKVTTHTTARLTPAGYLLTGIGVGQHGLVAPTGPFKSISLTVTSTIPPPRDGLGPQCVSGSGPHPDLYQLDVHSDGEWWLESRVAPAGWDGPAEELQTGDVGTLTGQPVIEITCVTLSLKGTTADMRVAGFVNGVKVVDMTTVATGVDPAGWQGGLLFGTIATASVTFTYFVARQLGA